jgi:diguanylate cyclase (GGDEF)-like protein
MAKILVVDDEPCLRLMLKDALSIQGYEVILAEDGKDGLLKIFVERPDIVLLDRVMPVMDGYEVVSNIRKNPQLVNLPVIMLTASEGDSAEIKGFDLGIDDYIKKPFKTPLLIARIRTILERKKVSVGSNPITSLPGNHAIRSEVEKRLALGKHFALIYTDLGNFKSYNDRYGFQKGDEVIKFTAKCLIDCINEIDSQDNFIGHIGGDDFAVLTASEAAEALAQNFIKKFDAGILDFYTQSDRKNGYIISLDRQNKKIKFPIMNVSVAIISTQITDLTHYADIASRAAELKHHAKQSEKSSYVFERRRK